MSIYLDNAATTRVCGEAAEAALALMTENYGNPSSTHAAGRQARDALKRAREQVSAALGCRPEELSFTSGGTESNNWALVSGAASNRRVGRHIISSEAEHDAVRKPLEYLSGNGFEITLLKPGQDGAVSAQDVAKALRADTALVSLMLVNNETGAVTDIRAVSEVLRAAGGGVLFHCDAVQGFLKRPFSPAGLGVDLLSLSGHKIHAPKGVGALYIRQGLSLPPLLWGGGQENGKRSGTESLPLIAALGAAATAGFSVMTEAVERMGRLRDRAVSRLRAENPEIIFLCDGAAHILSLSLPGYRSEVLMNFLDANGIFVSKSSACKRGGRSHVLEAMGLPVQVIDGAVRVSLSRYTTEEEIDSFCACLKEARLSLLRTL